MTEWNLIDSLVEWRTQEGNKVAGCVDNNDIWSAGRSAEMRNEEKIIIEQL